MPPSERLSRGSRGAEVALGIVLLARATTAISLAVGLTVNAPGWRAAFRGIAWYALLDGGFAMLTAALFAATRYRGGPVALVVTALVDAIVRISLALALLTLPAILDLPMTVVPLFGVVGATAALLGAIGILSWAVAHHRRQREHSVAYEAFFDPIPVIALVSLVIGARLAIDPPGTAPQLRPLVAAGGIGVAIGFAVAGVGSLLEGLRGRASGYRRRHPAAALRSRIVGRLRRSAFQLPLSQSRPIHRHVETCRDRRRRASTAKDPRRDKKPAQWPAFELPLLGSNQDSPDPESNPRLGLTFNNG